MRTTDDLQDKAPWQPLGERVKPAPAPAPPAPQPRGQYGIVEENGRFRTTKDPQ